MSAEPVSIQVGGNVEGSIVIGNNNFVGNTIHGNLVYNQPAPRVEPRQFAPQPPRPPRGFVNRAQELSKLETWISTNEIVLLHAPDGMGKSALLRQAANSAAAKAMPGGVILLESVDLAGQALGSDDIIQKLFDALFVSNPPMKVDAVTARTYLSNTRPLILMDEVGLSPAFQKILPDLFPKGAILISADVPIGADFQRLSVGPLPRAEAVGLLAARAGLILNDTDRAALEKICALLDDVSLAIVITGNVLREMRISPEAALQSVETISVPERDAVLAALNRAFIFAFNQLSPPEQKVLSAAALTPGLSMTPEWLSAALGGVNVDAFIERLKALGLLFANSPRLRLPPGLRAPAQRVAQLDVDVLLPRLVEFLIAPLRDNPQNWDHIHDELGNFMGALAWAARVGRPADVIALGRALDPYLSLRGLWDIWDTTLTRILDAAQQSGQPAVEAWALHQSGVRAMGVGTRRQALHFLRRALDLRRTLGDTVGMAYTQHNINLLIGAPPAPPDRPTSQPSAATHGGGPNLFLLAGGLAVLGILAFTALAIFLWFLFPPPPIAPATDTPTPQVVTSTPLLQAATLTPFMVLTNTSTLSPTATRTPTLTPTATPTPTLTLTPLGGSRQIAFQSHSTDTAAAPSYLVEAISVDGSSLQTVLKSNVAPQPAWSFDGQSLAYVFMDDSYNGDSRYKEIYIIDSTGRSSLATHESGNNFHPAWSPDGTQLAFVNGDPAFSSDIYILDIKSGKAVNLTNGDGGRFDYPEWSPDGKRIAYQAFVGLSWELFVMYPDGSGVTRLTTAQKEGFDSIQPSWSPDGQRIAFASNRSGDWDIYIMDMNSESYEVKNVTQDEYYDATPDWSPDGRLIAFSSNRGGSFQVYIMADDGFGVRLLTGKLKDVDSDEPDWRP